MSRYWYSRPDKLTHVDTVLYEVQMLRFAALELRNGKCEKDAWVYLEAFLLHFRNLINFLRMEKKNGGTDICAASIWQDERLPEEQLKQVQNLGKELYAQYEPSNEQGGGRISQYLAHCTTTRIVPKQWRIDSMYLEIEPALRILEQYLKPSATFQEFVKPIPPVEFREPLSASTTVGTHTASGVLSIENVATKSQKGWDTLSDSPLLKFE